MPSSRRDFLRSLAAVATLNATSGLAADGAPITRPIPSSGERLPVIGLGTWITFNVPPDVLNEAPLVPVMRTFFQRGGAMIDSSPMYGYSESVIGDLLTETKGRDRLFSATKIWTPMQAIGRSQFAVSLRLWGLRRFD